MNIDKAAITPAQKQQKSIEFVFWNVFQAFVVGRPATNSTKARFLLEISNAIRIRRLPVSLPEIDHVTWINVGASVVGLSVPVKISGVKQVVLLRADLAANSLKKALLPTASAPVAA